MDYQPTSWIPLFHILPPEDYIPPSLHTLRNLKPTVFHLGDDYLCPHKFLLPPEDNGEKLSARVTRNVVEVTEKADWERVENFSYILGIGNGKLDKITSCNQLVENETNYVLYKFRALSGHQGPLKATDLILNGCKYTIYVEWEIGEKTYKPLSALAADNPVTYDTKAKENNLLPIEGCQWFKNLAKRDKPDLSRISSPKREMKSTLGWTRLSKTPTSSTLCFGEPTLEKLDQETECCITIHITFGDSVVHTGTTLSIPSSFSETSRVSDCHSSLVTTPSLRMILDKLEIEVTKDPTHHVGKNGEHFIKSNQHMNILHAFINYVRATFNHGLSPSEVDWDDPKGEPTQMSKYTSSGCMSMEVDWGGNLKPNYTSCGCILMEFDWGVKLIHNSIVDC